MRFRFAFITVLLTVASQAFAVCSSPAPGYQDVGGTCLPSAPSTDFSPPGGVTSLYPICGPGRIALSGDGNYTATNFSGSLKPAWNGVSYAWGLPADNQTYSYTYSSDPNTPIYGYPPGWRCYCGTEVSTAVAIPPPSPAPSTYPSTIASAYNITTPTGTYATTARQYPVTYDVISSQTQAQNVFYGPVPVAKDSTVDGRIYGKIPGGQAICGCPNVNERVNSYNGTDGGRWVGSTCVPSVSFAPPVGTTQPVRVLTTFDPVKYANQVRSTATEETDASNNIVTQVLLPNSGADQVGMTLYNRRIWACADPYELDTNYLANCFFVRAHHQCDDGTVSGQPSAVSDSISPNPSPTSTPTTASEALQFNNTVNRKLACCLNAFHLYGNNPYEKFDCIDNSQTSYASFDALWSESDSVADGGQMNAILLSTGATVGGGSSTTPPMVSGFYGLDGHHCDQFSEFAYPPNTLIQHYRVNPYIKSSQQFQVGGTGVVTTGTTHPLPSGTNYAAIYNKVTSLWGKTVPTARNDMLNCPLLVRAAIVASCPSATVVPNALTTITATGVTRCAAAGGIQIHVRIDQVFEITGTAPIVPMDTFVQVNETTSLDVSKIISSKIGNQCPPGTTKKGDLCSY